MLKYNQEGGIMEEKYVFKGKKYGYEELLSVLEKELISMIKRNNQSIDSIDLIMNSFLKKNVVPTGKNEIYLRDKKAKRGEGEIKCR